MMMAYMNRHQGGEVMIVFVLMWGVAQKEYAWLSWLCGVVMLGLAGFLALPMLEEGVSAETMLVPALCVLLLLGALIHRL
ncbi:hypothetical protein JD969_09840 [Planctomycetota bacterium]|nr:hypothetical protein JD969_09840 [Planctomycetota bacterium]